VTAFDALFVPDELREAVSSRSWLGAMLEAERALALAGARAGIVPEAAAARIAEECSVDAYDWDALLEEWRLSGSPAEPLVRALVGRLGEDAGKWVHVGATSQDIVDTAAMLVTRRALGLVIGQITRGADACAVLARAHRDAPMAGRTLLQHAVPTTFGLKAAGWLVALGDVGARLDGLRQALPAQLGGAAGTLSALGDHGLEVATIYARELRLAEPIVPWHANRVVVAELGAALAVAAGAVAKICVDLQLLAQTEVGEVREGGNGGSSAMPQKRNPVGATWARAGAELARGHALVLVGAAAAEHERSAGSWQAESDAISGALATAGGAAAALAATLEGLEVDTERMRANLALTGGAIASERLALTLTERLGRNEARELVRDAALHAAATGQTLAEAVAGLDSGLSGPELDAVLDPETYLGSAGALVDRALARYGAAREDA
jgi:3-carboxy-cis,cis-muconate cycloisomerase